MIERFNRWRLFYLDFVESTTVQELVIKYPELNTFTPHPDMCCMYLGKSAAEACICDGKITVSSFNMTQSKRLLTYYNYKYDCVYLNLKISY